MNVIYPSGWTFTGHALQRMDEMGLLVSDVHAALNHADLSYPGRDGHDGQKRQVRVSGSIAVVVANEDRRVVTVLWNGGQGRTYLPPAA